MTLLETDSDLCQQGPQNFALFSQKCWDRLCAPAVHGLSSFAFGNQFTGVVKLWKMVANAREEATFFLLKLLQNYFWIGLLFWKFQNEVDDLQFHAPLGPRYFTWLVKKNSFLQKNTCTLYFLWSLNLFFRNLKNRKIEIFIFLISKLIRKPRTFSSLIGPPDPYIRPPRRRVYPRHIPCAWVVLSGENQGHFLIWGNYDRNRLAGTAISGEFKATFHSESNFYVDMKIVHCRQELIPLFPEENH